MVYRSQSDNHCNWSELYMAVWASSMALLLVLLLATIIIMSPSSSGTHTCIHSHMHTHTYTHAQTYTHAHTHTFTHTHICMHACIHICAHTHTGLTVTRSLYLSLHCMCSSIIVTVYIFCEKWSHRITGRLSTVHINYNIPILTVKIPEITG